MLKTDTLRNLGVALLVGVLSLSTVNPAAAIGVVGHGTYFGRYNNPLHGGAVASVAPAYVAPAYAAPAPVYAAPVVAPAPVYAPQAVSCVPACAPVCNPCPSPCDPCSANSCYRPVQPAAVYQPAVPVARPVVTGGYPQTPVNVYRIPVTPFWP